MLFNSFEFLLFFPLVTFLYFALPHKYRWFMLLAASCIFYMAFIPVYILILLLTILVDYYAGIAIEKTSHAGRKKFYLVSSLVVTGLILFVFKYFNFFNGSAQFIATKLGMNYPVPDLSIILPIGLSFHTFQSMSYVIEVYRGNQKAERNFGIYSLYVMFYPQLVAGPIERPQNVLHQFHERHSFDYNMMVSGIRLIMWGMFKKVVIADRLAVYAGSVFDDPHAFHGMPILLGILFFTFQIYCDFSGYSDIAIGTARVMGFRLMTNFDKPYFSKSISEFWRRWHISLSTWFRDYLYIPMGGNRVARTRVLFNLMVTFMVSGLWHGANWTFIIWGFLHGFYLVFAMVTANARNNIARSIGLTRLPGLNNALNIGSTFVLVAFAWIFFRATSIGGAFTLLRNLIKPTSWDKMAEILSRPEIQISFLVIAFLLLVERLQKTISFESLILKQPKMVRYGFYYLSIVVIYYFGYYGNQQFIYFQF